MLFITVLLIIAEPITVNKGIVYCPESEAEIDPGALPGKNLWLCHFRVVDSLSNSLLKGVNLTINPLEKSYLIKDGRAKFALRPGLYSLVLTKEKYNQVTEKVRMIPDQISMVSVAMTKLKEVIEQEKRETRIGSLMTLGVGIFEQDSLSKAQDIFRQILLIDSAHQGAAGYLSRIDTRNNEMITKYKMIADSLSKRRRYKEAIEVWNKVLVIDSTNQDAKDNIEKLEKAIKTSTMVTKEDLERYYQSGVELFLAGKYKQAYRMFRKILRYNPHHGGAKSYLRRTEARIKSIQK